jgi:hypothetical protein
MRRRGDAGIAKKKYAVTAVTSVTVVTSVTDATPTPQRRY